MFYFLKKVSALKLEYIFPTILFLQSTGRRGWNVIETSRTLLRQLQCAIFCRKENAMLRQTLRYRACVIEFRTRHRALGLFPVHPMCSLSRKTTFVTLLRNNFWRHDTTLVSEGRETTLTSDGHKTTLRKRKRSLLAPQYRLSFCRTCLIKSRTQVGIPTG